VLFRSNLNAYGVAVGYGAGYCNNYYGVAVGYCAGYCNNAYGVAVGRSAGYNNADGVAVGYQAGYCNNFVGVAVGCGAGYCNNYTGTAVGYRAGYCNNYNGVAVGLRAGQSNNAYGTAVGYWANMGTAYQYATAIGYYAESGADGQFRLGTDNATYMTGLYSRVSLTVSSDERDKTDIVPINGENAYNIIKTVEPIEYLDNPRADYRYDGAEIPEAVRHYGTHPDYYDAEAHARADKKGKYTHLGVKAQQLEAVLEQFWEADQIMHVVADSARLTESQGYIKQSEVETDYPGVESIKSVQYERLVPLIIAAVQVIQRRLETLEASEN
jgi:hypothetical protein